MLHWALFVTYEGKTQKIFLFFNFFKNVFTKVAEIKSDCS